MNSELLEGCWRWSCLVGGKWEGQREDFFGCCEIGYAVGWCDRGGCRRQGRMEMDWIRCGNP